MKKFKCPIYLTILSSVFFFSQITPGFAQLTQGNQLNQLVQQITRVDTPNRSEAEYRAASKAYQNILNQLDKLEPKELNFEEQIDLDLAVAHVKRQLLRSMTFNCTSRCRSITMLLAPPIAYLSAPEPLESLVFGPLFASWNDCPPY
jgi:uncharacterized protein (DUF885 family)